MRVTPYVTFLSVVWILGSSGALRADKAGEKLYTEYTTAIGKVKTFQADIDGTFEGDGATRKGNGFLAFKSPIYLRVHLVDMVSHRVEEEASNGKQAFLYSSDANSCLVGASAKYMSKRAPNGPAGILVSSNAAKQYRASFGSPTVGKPMVISTQTCQALEFAKGGDHFRIYLGPDKLPHGTELKLGTMVSRERYTNARVDQPVPATVFAWQPPAKVKRKPMFP